jgi:hypothetical protein
VRVLHPLAVGGSPRSTCAAHNVGAGLGWESTPIPTRADEMASWSPRERPSAAPLPPLRGAAGAVLNAPLSPHPFDICNGRKIIGLAGA